MVSFMASGKVVAIFIFLIVGLGVLLYYDGIIGTNKINTLDDNMVGQKVRIRGIVDSRISFLGFNAISVKDDTGSITVTVPEHLSLPPEGVYVVVEGILKDNGGTLYIEAESIHQPLFFH